MNRRVAEACSVVSQNLARVKEAMFTCLGPGPEYNQLRELIGDSQMELARLCDTAPINLIAGKVDEIVSNYRESGEVCQHCCDEVD